MVGTARPDPSNRDHCTVQLYTLPSGEAIVKSFAVDPDPKRGGVFIVSDHRLYRFDANAAPFAACFTDRADLTPYTAKPNRVRLDDMNPQPVALRGQERYWAERSLALDWKILLLTIPRVLTGKGAY